MGRQQPFLLFRAACLFGISGGSIDIDPEPFTASRMAQLLCKMLKEQKWKNAPFTSGTMPSSKPVALTLPQIYSAAKVRHILHGSKQFITARLAGGYDFRDIAKSRMKVQ